MTPHQVIAVAVRLFAIWLAIYSARMAPAFYREVTNAGDASGGIAVILISLLVALAVLFLWFFPSTVARTLLDSNSPPPGGPASPDTWFAIGCALLGLWLMIPALAALIYNLSLLYLAQRDTRLDMTNVRPAWIYDFIEVGFGVWLLLGARGVRRIFWAMRHES